MVEQSFGVDVELHQGSIPSTGATALRPEQDLGLVSLVVLVCGCLTMLILGVMAIARMGTVSRLADLPEAYLPNNLLPPDVSCVTPVDEPMPRRSIHLLGEEIYFSFDAESGVINSTSCRPSSTLSVN